MNLFLFQATSNIGGALEDLDSPVKLANESFNLQTLITSVIGLILVIAIVVCFFFLLYAGIRWITAGGDKEQTATAQKTLTGAVIGLAIALSAWIILGFTLDFFGIDRFFESSAEKTRRIYGPYYTGD